MIKEMYPNCTQ